MSKVIHIRVPENTLRELKKLKGNTPWSTFFFNGVKHRVFKLRELENTGDIRMSQEIKPEPLLKDEEALKFNDFIRNALADHPNFFDLFHKLGRSPCTLEIYDYLLWAETPVTIEDIIQSGVSSSSDSVFRAIKNLREMGLVACIGYKHRHNKVVLGGPRHLRWVAV